MIECRCDILVWHMTWEWRDVAHINKSRRQCDVTWHLWISLGVTLPHEIRMYCDEITPTPRLTHGSTFEWVWAWHSHMLHDMSVMWRGTYERVVSCGWVVPCMCAPDFACVMSHTWMSLSIHERVCVHENGWWHTLEWVVPCIWMRQITHTLIRMCDVNRLYVWRDSFTCELCHTYECVMSHIRTRHITHTSHDLHTNESRPTCENLTSHVHMRHIQR